MNKVVVKAGIMTFQVCSISLSLVSLSSLNLELTAKTMFHIKFPTNSKPKYNPAGQNSHLPYLGVIAYEAFGFLLAVAHNGATIFPVCAKIHVVPAKECQQRYAHYTIEEVIGIPCEGLKVMNDGYVIAIQV